VKPGPPPSPVELTPPSSDVSPPSLSCWEPASLCFDAGVSPTLSEQADPNPTQQTKRENPNAKLLENGAERRMNRTVCQIPLSPQRNRHILPRSHRARSVLDVFF
jgi:hypothetical protein